MNIKFGTDGWRAVIAQDFTFENLTLVTKAISEYIQKNSIPGEGMIVGYDMRFLSEEFAERVSKILAAAGIKVYVMSKPAPTPVTAFAITYYNCKGAIMLTASHNPAIYHGIKYIPYFAGPALPETTKEIENILAEVNIDEKYEDIAVDEYKKKNMIAEIDPFEAYITKIKDIVDISLIKQNPLKIVLDPMYGAGTGYLEEFLKDSGCEIISIHNCRDPFFGGGLPEPKEDRLQELKQQMLNQNADLGLAFDGDADRFGIIDKNGEYINPNQVLSLILDHLITRRNWSGKVARTVATTHMLDAISEAQGMSSVETPVGFKYIGKELREGDCILGGEESGGLSIKGHIPEKDGILACLLVLELVSASGNTLSDNLESISNKYGTLVSKRYDIEVSSSKKEKILKELEEYHPVEINGKPVVEKITVDGSKYKLVDGSWILIRPSGTEPLFRIYIEAADINEIEKMKNQIRKEVIKE